MPVPMLMVVNDYKKLVEAGGDRKYKGAGSTALEVARSNKLEKIIKLLTKQPAAKSETGSTPR